MFIIYKIFGGNGLFAELQQKPVLRIIIFLAVVYRFTSLAITNSTKKILKKIYKPDEIYYQKPIPAFMIEPRILVKIVSTGS